MMRIELISAVIAVTEDVDDIAAAYRSYRPALAGLGRPVEFIYVVDGPMPQGDAGAARAEGRRRADRDPVLRDAVRRGRRPHGGLPPRRRRRRVHADPAGRGGAGRRCRGCWRRWRPAISSSRGASSAPASRRRSAAQVRAHRQRAVRHLAAGHPLRRAGDARRGGQGADHLRQPVPVPAAAGPGAGLRRARARPAGRAPAATGRRGRCGSTSACCSTS